MINLWMGNFAYQTTISYVTFGIVTIIALMFSFFTVGFHSLKTARTNPVESLKYE
jgi:putative ABC transport system permease protein